VNATGRNARSPRGGFTLIEVLVALGIFLMAILTILGLFFQSIKTAIVAREEIIIAIIQRDVSTRNQVAAARQAADMRAWCEAAANRTPAAYGAGIGATFMTYGDPDDTDPDGAGPQDVLALGWGVRNPEAYNALVAGGAGTGREWPIEADLEAGDQSMADIVSLYRGFIFTVSEVIRDETNMSAPGIPGAANSTPGIVIEDNQFTDMDGYGSHDTTGDGELDRDFLPAVDMDNDGTDEASEGLDGKPLPYPSIGPLRRGSLALLPASPTDEYRFRIFYNSNGMRNYVKRLRCTIGWNLRSATNIRSGYYEEYYFSVFNLDAVKRWR